MPNILLAEQEKDFLKRGFSRRSLGRIAAMIGVGSTLPFYNEAALAQLSFAGTPPPDAVMLIGYEPWCVRTEVLIVSIVAPDPPRLDGLNTADVSIGNPVAPRFKVPEYAPFTLMMNVAVPP